MVRLDYENEVVLRERYSQRVKPKVCRTEVSPSLIDWTTLRCIFVCNWTIIKLCSN